MEGASDALDNMYYDAPKNLSTGTASILYSRIEGNLNTKLAIQSKAESSLNMEEVISLGFYTAIEEARRRRAPRETKTHHNVLRSLVRPYCSLPWYLVFVLNTFRNAAAVLETNDLQLD